MTNKNKIYERKEANGHFFAFKYDSQCPDQLHIEVRHMGTMEETIVAFFEGETVYEAEHKRYRTLSDDYFVLWFWIDQAKKIVMIISAGPRKGGTYSTEES